MRTSDIILKNDYAVTVTPAASTDLDFILPEDGNIHAVDVTLIFDSLDTFSKDITFRLKEINGQYEDFAFWDDSNETIFADFLKLVNRAWNGIRVTILNNDATNNIVVEYLHIRIYFYD